MGFSGGNSGNGNGGTPTQTSIRIPQARLEIVKRDEKENDYMAHTQNQTDKFNQQENSIIYFLLSSVF